MPVRRSFRLRTLLLLVAVAGLCVESGVRYFVPKCCHHAAPAQVICGPFENHIIVDAVVNSRANGERFVDFHVEAYQRSWVRSGLSASLRDLDSGATIADGNIAAIGAQPVRENTWGKPPLVYPVQVTLASVRGAVRDGTKVRVCIPVQQHQDALQVPLESVFEVEGFHYVIVKNGRHLEPRRVRIKADNARRVVIDRSSSDALPAGACVIASRHPRPWLVALRRHVATIAKGGAHGRGRLTLDCCVCGRALSDHIHPSAPGVP